MKFQNWEQMYEYLETEGDLYNISTETYVFMYNDLGALCIYNLSEDEAKDIAKKAEQADDSWSAFLGIGGQILEDNSMYEHYRRIGEEVLEDVYLLPSVEFCKEHFNKNWIRTEDYLKVTSRNPLYHHEISLIDGSYKKGLAHESFLLRKNSERVILDKQRSIAHIYSESESVPESLVKYAGEYILERIRYTKDSIKWDEELLYKITHLKSNAQELANEEETRECITRE